MRPIDRRSFLKSSLLGTAAVSLPGRQSLASAKPPAQPGLAAQTAARKAPVVRSLGIIDTNVNLFDWPFRALKYRHIKALVTKLKKHRIIEAWAGSFEAL